MKRFNRTLCEGIAKVTDIVLDWDTLIQPVLFAYRTKKLCITNATPYELVYGKNVTIPMDNHRNMTYMDRMIDIMEEVPQLRTNAKRAIKKAQQKIERSFRIKGLNLGKTNLYFILKS